MLSLLATTVVMPAVASAQEDYPARPVRLVVGFPAGSSTDVATRALAEGLSRSLGAQFVVENRPGASSNIAARSVASGAADGYTLFVGTIANTISITIQPETSVDIEKEFVPIAMVGSVPNLLVVHPSLEVDSVKDLVDLARKRPGEITYASSGNGTSPHLSGELFAHMADVRLVHVPYKGSSPAVVDLIAGQVKMMFSPISTALPHVRDGKLRALASTSAKRARSLPDLPTIQEAGLADFETSVWFGLNAPRGTPEAIIRRVSQAVASAQSGPDLVHRFEAQGIETVQAGPKEYGEVIRRETAKWAEVIRSAKVGR